MFHALVAMTLAVLAVVQPLRAQSSSELRISGVEVIGTQLKLTGQHFGEAEPLVTLDDTALAIVNHSDTEIVVDISGIAPGSYGVTVARDGGSTPQSRSNVGVVIE